MSAIFLSNVTGRCRECGYEAHQIDASREHAIQVVTEAVERHMAEEHPEVEA